MVLSSRASRRLAVLALATLTLCGPLASAPLSGQAVEIISGAAAAPADLVRPGVRVIAFVQIDDDRTQHRVVKPLLAEEILLIQESLAEAGAETGARDGLLGESTMAALSRFQEEAALEPCACVNYATILALGLPPRIVQTVVGEPDDESDAEVVVGNTQLPETPTPVVVPVAAPPETVVVVQQSNNGWWTYPRFFSAFPPRGSGVGDGRAPGFPFGPVLRLGAPRAVPFGR